MVDGIEQLIPDVKKWRHHLHTFPETAFQEFKTAEFIADTLRTFGLDVHTGIGGTGVVGTLQKGASKAGMIGLRADMDGLDIQEENDFAHRSQNDGRMHACGHDGHTAMLLGAAQWLSRSESFDGTVQFIFQPAEENGGGSLKMIEDGLFDRFPVDAVFGLHNFPDYPFGSFSTATGPLMAAFDKFDILIKGVGGHSSMPHQGQDCIGAAAQLITQLKSFSGSSISPFETSVVSITQICGGSTYNVLPNEVALRGSVRHFSLEVQNIVESRINSIVKGVATALEVSCELDYNRCYPVVINPAEETALAIKAAQVIVGEGRVEKNTERLMGSEDFAFMLQKKPGNFIILGAGDANPGHSLHQSRYDFNDDLLPIGISYWLSLVKTSLPLHEAK